MREWLGQNVYIFLTSRVTNVGGRSCSLALVVELTADVWPRSEGCRGTQSLSNRAGFEWFDLFWFLLLPVGVSVHVTVEPE